MRHRKHTFKIGRRSDHVKALLANQACSLILEERIETTVVKAKETRRLVERMITLGKRGTLHHRRLAIARIRNVAAVGKLFSDVAPRYQERDGGYTRIIRLGQRIGDGAETCFLELVEAGAPISTRRREPSAQEAASVVAAKAAAELDTTVAEAAAPAAPAEGEQA